MKLHSANDILIYLKNRECSFTCSLDRPKNNSLTFIRDSKFLNKLYSVKQNIFAITSVDIYQNIRPDRVPSNVDLILTNDDVNYVFAEFHNQVNKDRFPNENIIGENCEIHETAIIDIDGQRIVKRPDGSNIRLKHMGNVVIGDNVKIDAMTTIHRASFDSTTIGDNSTICSHVNIGHNCIIGTNTFIAPGCKIAGSTKIGNNCNIWQGCLIKNGITICDDVTIGMGSVVTKDIIYPGTYFGSPCKLQKNKE